jgi:hypothetical protein
MWSFELIGAGHCLGLQAFINWEEVRTMAVRLLSQLGQVGDDPSSRRKRP